MNDRARVPFALLGVLLLVGSASYAASLSAPTPVEPGVEASMEEFTAESRTAVAEAARDAAMGAAADPVTAPANTTAGRALGSDGTFRDSLRLRVYTRVREALDATGRRDGRFRLSASLPVPETRAELRRAVGRVTVERAGPDGTELLVTVGNVSLSAHRKERVVARKTVSPTVRVAVPTLAVHERVALFERRLEAGPTEPGLGRRLTATLYPLAWTRGYAQYGGAPIENVVANRHVALATNGAVLDIQRSVFGTSDPVGRRVLGRATARTAISDALAGSGHPGLKALKRARGYAGDPSPLPDRQLGERARAAGVSPEAEVTVGVNATADRAFLSYLDPDRGLSLAGTLRHHYEVDVRRRVEAAVVSNRRTGGAVDAGENWTLVGTTTETTTTVEARAADPPEPTGDWHVLAHHPRRVVAEVVNTRVWRTPSGTRRTYTRRVRKVDVTVLLMGNHTVGNVLRAPVRPVHDRGGALNGPNLADVRGKARAELLAPPGGPDSIARAVAAAEDVRVRAGTFDAERDITGDRPTALERWVYRDLADLRRRVANISMTTSRANISTFGVNPPKRLRAKLEARRATLVDRPGTYDGVADRARVAARVRYLDRVSSRLASRGRARADRAEAVSAELGARSEGELHESYRGRERRQPVERSALPMVVDARPSYLTTAAVDGGTLPSLGDRSGHPLAVRNTNLASAPYADAVGGLVDALAGPDLVAPSRAAQVLRVANATRTLRGESPSRPNRELTGRVADSVARMQARFVLALEAEGVGTRDDRRSLVANATARWDGAGSKVRAIRNGSAAAALHRAAARAYPLTLRERDRLRLRLERATRTGLAAESVRIEQPAVRKLADTVRTTVKGELRRRADEIARQAGRAAAERLGDRVLSTATGRRVAGDLLGKLPMGVPLAPAPGFWYVTANFWDIDVRGVYAQFVVRVPRGAPGAPGGFRYVRDGDPVGLDVDADGDRELLGRATRVDFATGTDIAVAVPPGPRGVADVDGQREEASAGWPQPGWK